MKDQPIIRVGTIEYVNYSSHSKMLVNHTIGFIVDGEVRSFGDAPKCCIQTPVHHL